MANNILKYTYIFHNIYYIYNFIHTFISLGVFGLILAFISNANIDIHGHIFVMIYFFVSLDYISINTGSLTNVVSCVNIQIKRTGTQ